MKIYIAGKITGLPFNHVKIKFDHAERWIKSLKHEPVNPINLFPDPESVPWETAMYHCLCTLDKCDAIYLLPDWTESRGAKEEVNHAIALGMPIFNENNIKNYA